MMVSGLVDVKAVEEKVRELHGKGFLRCKLCGCELPPRLSVVFGDWLYIVCPKCKHQWALWKVLRYAEALQRWYACPKCGCFSDIIDGGPEDYYTEYVYQCTHCGHIWSRRVIHEEILR